MLEYSENYVTGKSKVENKKTVLLNHQDDIKVPENGSQKID